MLEWILGYNISTISISIKMDCNGAFGQGQIATHKWNDGINQGILWRVWSFWQTYAPMAWLGWHWSEFNLLFSEEFFMIFISLIVKLAPNNV